jgi:hypothetical protein
MLIRVVSSLTVEDEGPIAKMLLAVVVRVLNELPIAYSVSVEGRGVTIRHTRTCEKPPSVPH